MFITAVIVLFINNFNLHAQKKDNSIYGFVIDKTTGEVLIGTNTLLYRDSISTILPPFAGVATNSYGYYIFPKLPKGDYFLIFRQIGYKTTIREVKFNYDNEKLVYNIGLQPESIELNEVVITGQKQENAASISTIDISPDVLSKLPGLTGEVDLFRLLQTLPGVGMASETSNGLYVRGGSPDQNLTLVDGVTIYNPSHLGNIASTFNSNAISDIKLIKGAYPAEYGGRLSSVLDIHLRSGTKEENKAAFGLGLINSFASLEGPVGEKSTYMISGRTMYYNLLVNNFNKASSIPRYGFSDLSSKITYSLSETSALSISGLYSKDIITSPSGTEFNYDIEWSNEFLSLDWLHINKNSVFFNSILSYIDYNFKSVIGLSPDQLTSSTYFASSRLRDVQLKEQAESKWNENNTLKGGLELTYHIYNLLYSNVYNSLLEENPFAGNNLNSFESAVYLENESLITPLFTANLGARLYYFNLQKYLYAEPHISFKYALTENNFLKAAFAQSHQYLHLIDRNDISLPTDLWYPSTKQILPAKSNEYVFGIDNYISNQTYLLSLEGYYRDMINLYEFKNNAALNPFDNSIENQFVKGKGEAYGIELFFNKRKGNFNGWIGCTLSWTKRQFDALNAGQVFYPKYDRRNDISVVISYKISAAFSTGLTWIYATGERYNLPVGQYIFQHVNTGQYEEIYLNHTGLNADKFPAYHKLDLNFSYTFTWLKNKMEAYVNILNVYNRQNPFAQYVTPETNPDGSQFGMYRRPGFLRYSSFRLGTSASCSKLLLYEVILVS